MNEPPRRPKSAGATMDRRLTLVRKPWWRQRITALSLLALFAMAMTWRILPASGSTDIDLSDLETGVVARAPFADYLPVRATVAPRLTTLVGVLSGGQVERLLVQDGAMVTVGEPLAKLVSPELRLDVLTREAQIAAQLGSVAGDEVALERNRLDRTRQMAEAAYDLNKARTELAKRRQLFEKGIISETGLKVYTDEVVYQQQRVAQLAASGLAEARTSGTQASRLADTRNRLTGNLDAVRAGLDAMVVRAPANGRLTNFTIQPGQTLKPGDPAGQIDSEGSWKLEADVDEFYLSRVHVGQVASADGSRLIVSKVLPTVKDGRFRIELTFVGVAPTGLNRGQALDVRVTLGKTASALMAPVGGWIDAGGGTSAFVLDINGRHARRRAIRTGRRNPEQVEILSGLSEGERIVTSNTSSVAGDVLNIR